PAVMRTQAGRAVGCAAVRERRGMEGIDCLSRTCAQADVSAGPGWDGVYFRPCVDPELGIVLAKADGRAADVERRISDRAEYDLIEAHRARKVADGDRDVVNHQRNSTVIPAERSESRDPCIPNRRSIDTWVPGLPSVARDDTPLGRRTGFHQ